MKVLPLRPRAGKLSPEHKGCEEPFHLTSSCLGLSAWVEGLQTSSGLHWHEGLLKGRWANPVGPHKMSLPQQSLQTYSLLWVGVFFVVFVLLLEKS